MKRLLVVEDHPDLAFGLKSNLELEGYRVEVQPDGRKGLDSVRRQPPDLVILDLMLPGMDGLRVLKELRREGCGVPVLILTARGEETDKVAGLRLGADDYVTKPFGLMELLARVQALLRRASSREGTPGPEGLPGGTAKPERFGDVILDHERRRVARRGEPVELSPKEFDLLVALVRRNGAVASRKELLAEVWGYAPDVHSRTVDTHIGELRRKIEEDPARPRHILTVRKAGYRFRREALEAGRRR